MFDPLFMYVVSIPVYIIFLIISIIKRQKITAIIFSSLFYFYCVSVISVTLFPLPYQKSTIEWGRASIPLENNFIPFTFLQEATAPFRHYTASSSYFDYALEIALKQVGGNILLGMPFGFLAPLIWKKRNTFLRILVAGFWFSFAIEASQFFISLMLGYTYRQADVDDIILNSTGVALGYFCLKLSKLLLKKISYINLSGSKYSRTE